MGLAPPPPNLCHTGRISQWEIVKRHEELADNTGVTVYHAVIDTSMGIVPIQVVNPGSSPVKIEMGQTVGWTESVGDVSDTPGPRHLLGEL